MDNHISVSGPLVVGSGKPVPISELGLERINALENTTLEGRRKIKVWLRDLDIFSPTCVRSRTFLKTEPGLKRRRLWSLSLPESGVTGYLEKAAKRTLANSNFCQVAKNTAWMVGQRIYLNELSRQGKWFICADAEAWESQHSIADITESIDALAIGAQMSPHTVVRNNMQRAAAVANICESRGE